MTVGEFLRYAIWVMLGLLGGRIAAYRGYSPWLGVVVGVFMGPFALLMALLIPRRRYIVELEKADLLRGGVATCPTCGVAIPTTSNECPRCIYRKAFP
jgi:hypothetical protein